MVSFIYDFFRSNILSININKSSYISISYMIDIDKYLINVQVQFGNILSAYVEEKKLRISNATKDIK